MSYHLSPGSSEPREFTLTAESEREREELVQLRDMLRGRDDLAAVLSFAKEGMSAYERRQRGSFLVVGPRAMVQTKDGNVVAACADTKTAALVAIALHRFESAGPLPFPAWKGPCSS